MSQGLLARIVAAIIIANENILTAHAVKCTVNMCVPKFILEVKIVRKCVVNTVVQWIIIGYYKIMRIP